MCTSCLFQDFERCDYCGVMRCREVVCKCRNTQQAIRLAKLIDRLDLFIAEFYTKLTCLIHVL